MSTCTGTKADGSPCGNKPLAGSDRCRHHQREESVADTSAGWMGELEQTALGRLEKLCDEARVERVRLEAAEAILRHVRDS